MSFRFLHSALMFGVWLVSALGGVYAADIEANKMEILNTNEGRVTVLKEGVTIIDRDTKITALRANFFEAKNLAILYDSIKIQNPQALIQSDTANYYLTERKTILKGNVWVYQESLEIFAPELIVEYQKDRAYAEKGFVILAKPHSVKITGRTGEYFFAQEEGTIDSLPYLVISKSDTLTVTCQKLSFKNKANLAIAQTGVKVETNRAVLTCDTLIYHWAKDSACATGNPKLKENNNELKGKIMYFFARNNANANEAQADALLDRLEIEGDAQGLYYTDEGDKVEIGGERLNLFFTEGKANSIIVFGVKYGKLSRRSAKS
jgi:lipopolysaccharide assembly outer membrane protein LptD (OstA)